MSTKRASTGQAHTACGSFSQIVNERLQLTVHGSTLPLLQLQILQLLLTEAHIPKGPLSRVDPSNGQSVISNVHNQSREQNPKGPPSGVDPDNGTSEKQAHYQAQCSTKARSNILTFLQLNIHCLTLAKGPKIADIISRLQPKVVFLSESNLNSEPTISSFGKPNRNNIWHSRNGLGDHTNGIRNSRQSG